MLCASTFVDDFIFFYNGLHVTGSSVMHRLISRYIVCILSYRWQWAPRLDESFMFEVQGTKPAMHHCPVCIMYSSGTVWGLGRELVRPGSAWKLLLKLWWCACCRSMQHNVLTRVGHRSWLDGFDPGDLCGHVIAVCVLEDNTVVLLKFQPNEPDSEQHWNVDTFAIPQHL